MSRDRPVPPSSAEILAAIGKAISHRELIRENSLSIVERVHFSPDHLATAVLKTTVPELSHEVTVQQRVSGFEISATSLIHGDPNARSPWLLLNDIAEMAAKQTPTPDDIGVALEMLAELHAQSVGWRDMDSTVPDRSITALGHQVLPVAKQAFSTVGIEMTASMATGVDKGIERARSELMGLPNVLVHGDFDPGNLAFSRGRWRVLDWGLAHRNAPLVDVAHMVMRFDDSTRPGLISRYVEAAREAGLDLGDSADHETATQLVEAANVAHMAFFAWWHSSCMLRYGDSFASHVSTIRSRLEMIASYADSKKSG